MYMEYSLRRWHIFIRIFYREGYTEIFDTRISFGLHSDTRFYSSLNHPVVAISRSTLCHRRCHGDKWHEVYSRLMTNFPRCIERKKKRKSGKFYSFPISKNHCCAQNSYYIASHWIKMYKTNNFMERKMKRDKTNTTIRTKNRKTLVRGGEETRESDRIFIFTNKPLLSCISFVAWNNNLTCCATSKILIGSLNETMD